MLRAIPPKPVAAPPIGIVLLPAASVRSSTLRPEEPSSTTIVWTVSAARVTGMEMAAPDALNFTVPVPGERAE